MRQKFTLIFLLFISFNTWSQKKEKFSSLELKTFLKIYKHTLDLPFDAATALQKSAKLSAIPEKRLSEILKAKFAGNKVELSDEEIGEMNTIKKNMQTDKDLYDNELDKYILKQKMTPKKYHEIENLYHANNKFQEKINKLSNNKN